MSENKLIDQSSVDLQKLKFSEYEISFFKCCNACLSLGEVTEDCNDLDIYVSTQLTRENTNKETVLKVLGSLDRSNYSKEQVRALTYVEDKVTYWNERRTPDQAHVDISAESEGFKAAFQTINSAVIIHGNSRELNFAKIAAKGMVEEQQATKEECIAAIKRLDNSVYTELQRDCLEDVVDYLETL